MIRPRSIINGVARIALWTLAILVAFVVLWFAGNRCLDESPDPNRDSFLVSASDQLPDEENIAIGILGLTAPRGSDFLEYGAKIKALSSSNTPWSEVQKMLRGPSTLQPTTEYQQIECWLDPDDLQMESCLPFDQAPMALAENREILERFKQLHQMKTYSGLLLNNNQAYLHVTKLAVAEIHVDLRKKDAASAYRKWRDQVSFAKKTLRGPDTWVGKAVAQVAIGLSLPVLENILLADPQLVKQHASELKTILRPEGIKQFNPEGIMRKEYAQLLNSLRFEPQQIGDQPFDRLHWLVYNLGQHERILNRYYFFARDYAAILNLPWSQFEKEHQRLKETFDNQTIWDVLVDPFGSLFFDVIANGQLQARELVRNMHIKDGQLRLSTLLVRIIDERVADKDIAQFLQSAGPEYFDPFTGKPMQWDPKQRIIFFPNPESSCSMYVALRVPTATTQSTTKPHTDERKC